MRKIYILIALLVVILVGAYLGRHTIKSILTGKQVPQQMMVTPTKTMAVPTDNIYKTASDPKLGTYLTDFDGKALYTYDKDTAGVSNCSGQCAVNWPYYTSGATAQKTLPESISVIKRADGHDQFAWKGMPLYYYIKDTKAGDTLGDGVGGVWHLVKP